MVLAADPDRVLDMGHDVLGRGMPAEVQERHEEDADETALFRHPAQFGVGLVARQVGQGAAAGVVDRDRLL